MTGLRRLKVTNAHQCGVYGTDCAAECQHVLQRRFTHHSLGRRIKGCLRQATQLTNKMAHRIIFVMVFTQRVLSLVLFHA
ncbi:MAG TPA: hypothetical protein DCM53_10925 [Enterobacteriaceae bacterium]|nr:hypothetical protein [Enterobacteriaceae bacterium]